MKYILLLILLLASPVAFCQHRYQPPKAIDTSGQHKITHYIYTFDGIVRKPWTFYSVINGELKPLSDNEQVSNKTKHWDKFILVLREIIVDCSGNSASVTIIYNEGKSKYLLKRSVQGRYVYNGVVNLMLIIKSSLICEFYFLKGDEAASISNMDWEIQ